MEKRKRIEVKIGKYVVYSDLIEEALKRNKFVDDLKAELLKTFKDVRFIIK